MTTWSPFSTQVMQDPANGHHDLLGQCPVHRCDEFDPPFYTLSLYADVENALRDIETYSSEFGQGPRFTAPQGMLCDPPQHTALRRVVQQAFTPPAMNALRPSVEALTAKLIDEVLAGKPTFDFHDEFAFPIPVIIIAGMLGVPESDLEQFKHWSDIQVAAMGSEDPSQYAEDQAGFMGYMLKHLQDRRARIASGDDVPEDLATIVADARWENGELIPEADALSVLTQLLVGGNETTTSLMTNALWRLLQVPERWQQLVDNPALAESVVEESLRYDPPVLGLYRNTTCDVELHGTTIPSGSKVLINYAAANRDPSVFENPDDFRPDRPRKRHMSFGLGVHFCLGAPMARMEAEIALRMLAERMPGLSLQGDGERIAPFFLWGRRRLPVAWR